MTSICKLTRLVRWYEPRFVCQLLEVIREAGVNETSVDVEVAMLGSLVGESQLGIPKIQPKIMFSNMVPLVSVDLEYHAV